MTNGSEITKYYFAGSTRVAMRKYTVPQSTSVEYFLTDHLDSTSITLDSNGAKASEMRYKAWGEPRYTWTATQTTTPGYKLPIYTYTGQASYIMDDPTTGGVTEGFGLMFYNARVYDPSLGRFAQADSIVPAGVQGLDRYEYVNNNPLRYIDQDGHFPTVAFLVTIVISAVLTSCAIAPAEPPTSTPRQNEIQNLIDNQDGTWTLMALCLMRSRLTTGY